MRIVAHYLKQKANFEATISNSLKSFSRINEISQLFYIAKFFPKSLIHDHYAAGKGRPGGKGRPPPPCPTFNQSLAELQVKEQRKWNDPLINEITFDKLYTT